MNELTEALENYTCVEVDADYHETLECGVCTIDTAARRWDEFPSAADVEAVAQAIKPYVDVDPAVEPNEWDLAQMHNARIAACAALEALKG